MKITKDHQSVLVPAGEYYLGDPLYFFKKEDWQKVLDTCRLFQDPIGKSTNGWPVLGFSTAYGDGLFRGSDGFYYAVDSGIIGLILTDGITGEIAKVERLCQKVQFPEETICSNDDGRMKFGTIVIDTGNEDDEDDDS